MKKSKIFMIASICTLCLSIIVSTYAMYRENLFDNLTVDTITNGLDYYISYDKGTDITSSTLDPSTDYTGGNSATITFGKKDNTYDIYGHIYLDIGAIFSSERSKIALKYALKDTDGSIIATGNLAGKNAGSSVLVKSNIPLDIESKTYTVYLWLDENEEIEPDIASETLTVTVRCEATMKPMTTEILAVLGDVYTNDPTKERFTNNNVDYILGVASGLMTDRLGGVTANLEEGNLRFFGATPNNYVYFNCSDYSKQASTTCELWRIIGIFDDKVKIMRNSAVTTKPWNTTISNDWSSASINTYLNNDYYNSLKNSETRNKIASATWYTGPGDRYLNTAYQRERSSTTWTGKIALPYLSDYGYAAHIEECNIELPLYNECNSIWMKTLISSSNGAWLLTPTDSTLNDAYNVNNIGTADFGAVVTTSIGIFPTLYLNTDVKILTGDGTISSPYQLQ